MMTPTSAAKAASGRSSGWRNGPAFGSVDPDVRDRTRAEIVAQWMLAIVTLILMASMGGGFLLLPVLIPAHLWAARRSGSLGRVGWSLLPVASLAMVAWAGLYVSIGESKPAIWLVPLLVVVGAFWAIQYVLAKDQRPLPD